MDDEMLAELSAIAGRVVTQEHVEECIEEWHAQNEYDEDDDDDGWAASVGWGDGNFYLGEGEWI